MKTVEWVRKLSIVVILLHLFPENLLQTSKNLLHLKSVTLNSVTIKSVSFNSVPLKSIIIIETSYMQNMGCCVVTIQVVLLSRRSFTEKNCTFHCSEICFINGKKSVTFHKICYKVSIFLLHITKSVSCPCSKFLFLYSLKKVRFDGGDHLWHSYVFR